MVSQLSAGSLSKILQGLEVTEPVLQVLGHKPIQGSGQERSVQCPVSSLWEFGESISIHFVREFSNLPRDFLLEYTNIL